MKTITMLLNRMEMKEMKVVKNGKEIFGKAGWKVL
ncbi:hypothetical protein MBGDF03_01030 [Thermoplasmatales archaeon SCGC AB-540-F20]|nr:hypothetical protein MBGDF03_01030 [Thermoplasmatales archaeon SCGC AB-540-F20]